MSCCSHSGAAGRFFSRFARRYRKRYLKKGFEPSQVQLIRGLEQAGINGAAVLEIGCGVGYLHQALLESGADRAAGVDLSDAMLDEARRLARERGLDQRVEYRVGDFVELADTLGEADIAILDKVVCCYPDAEALLRRSLEKTGRVYALTYPRERWFVCLGVAVGAFALWLIRSTFRSYVHDPAQIEAWITARGFAKVYQAQTPVWLTQVYVRG